jgi:hypothetical protein
VSVITIRQPAPDQILADLISAVQAYMDAEAQKLGYDSIFTATTYADEAAVAKFQQEGQEFRRWRSVAWAYCYQAMDDALEGRRTVPTAEELINELPALNLT